ncbi:MAG TPA: ribbon-helix-helix domain-containing protein [Nocardioidaceae bacterium]|nr:ribbon-helix-helix domain-containing protein [Nocardioidaceae bacterium]
MTSKIAVSLPDDLLEAARRAVREGRASSVSGFVAQAIAERERSRDLAVLVAEIIAEDGEPAPEDYAWADQALGLA